MTNRYRSQVILLAALIAFLMIFSALFIALESGHDCTGEECRICYQISICESTLKKIIVAVITSLFAVVLLDSIRVRFLYCFVQNRIGTLVTLKVKLSN